jgi:hypothetical protein
MLALHESGPLVAMLDAQPINDVAIAVLRVLGRKVRNVGLEK